MRVDHLGTFDGAHATRAALGNKCHRDIVAGARPSRVRDRTGRKADLLGSRRVHRGQGRSQHIHCSIESRGICVEHRIARSKLAHDSLSTSPRKTTSTSPATRSSAAATVEAATGSVCSASHACTPSATSPVSSAAYNARSPADRARARRQRESRTRPPPSSETGEYDRMTA
jgi:hypothetical protein